MKRVLVIDDEPGIRSILQDILEDEGYEVSTAGDGIEGLEKLEKSPVELVILDVWLPKMGGIDVLKEIKKGYPETEVIIISGHANIDLAVKAVKIGAFDFLEKPLSLDRVVNLVKNALEIQALKTENRTLKHTITAEDDFIGESPAIQAIKERIGQSAPSDAKILILGENGTGKELVAREIHRRSLRPEGPFVEVNCAAIPESLIESELFGHQKGAFTHAVSTRKGKFELADGGTLFLDEIADMSMPTQAKVLRAIQELQFERVGGEDPIKVDVRIIAATNKDLEKEVKEGRFREDLYFRLNVVPVIVPPLRERGDDLVLLIDYLLEKRQEPGSEKTFSPEALEVLKNHHWPGNIRELKNFVERILIMTDETEIQAETVKTYLGTRLGESQDNDGTIEEFTDLKLNEAKDQFEKRLIEQKLRENEYNVARTAQALGIYPSNLHGKIRKFDIEVKR